jgi:hypothetical protein
LNRSILTHEDLPYHKTRVYFFGDNSLHNQWFLAKERPAPLKNELNKSAYSSFIKVLNKIAQWSTCEKCFIQILYVLYLPVGLLVYYLFRKKYARKIQLHIATLKEVIINYNIILVLLEKLKK